MTDLRAQDARDWLTSLAGPEIVSFLPAPADASFRRYFRVQWASGPSQILMDCPPDREDCRPFLAVCDLLSRAGVKVPEILAADPVRGYLLMSDLGQKTFLETLMPTPDAEIDYALANDLMTQAFETLLLVQQTPTPDWLPPYDATLLQYELDLFVDWYLVEHLKYELTDADQATLKTIFSGLLDKIARQPTVFTHRDYMVRNLMVPEDGDDRPGVIDFQDAVVGPITYDCASLLADAFITFDEELTLDWLIKYREKAQKIGLPVNDDIAAFHRDVETIALQRHLKVIGIFCRLNYRDGKPRYLTELPRFSNYIRRTCERYDEFRVLLPILNRAEGRSPGRS
jgi:aminoglycoside/choline kinase family phosphotransferase